MTGRGYFLLLQREIFIYKNAFTVLWQLQRCRAFFPCYVHLLFSSSPVPRRSVFIHFFSLFLFRHFKTRLPTSAPLLCSISFSDCLLLECNTREFKVDMAWCFFASSLSFSRCFAAFFFKRHSHCGGSSFYNVFHMRAFVCAFSAIFFSFFA